MKQQLSLTEVKNVQVLMASSKNEQEWNDNCDKVKAANGGDYPSFWFTAVILSGIASQTQATW
jgi:hypothetical protein